MDKEKFDRNKPHKSLEEIGKDKLITPEHAQTITAGWERLNESRTDEKNGNNFKLYDGLGGPEEREPDFKIPKTR